MTDDGTVASWSFGGQMKVETVFEIVTLSFYNFILLL